MKPYTPSRWLSKVALKHLMTTDETHEAVQASMNAIADAICKDSAFLSFNRAILAKFRAIPTGDEFFAPVEYANKLISSLYDYADENRIWIE